MSRHHWITVRVSKIVPSSIKEVEWKWNQTASPDVISRAAIAPVRGHGLGSTIW